MSASEDKIGSVEIKDANNYNKLKIKENGSLDANLNEGSNFIGRSGAKCFEVALEITRPSDTAQYAAGDLINTATNATLLPAFDFTTEGGLPNQKIQIHSISIISSNGAVAIKLSPWISLYMSPVITGQNLGDNQAFNPSYSEIISKRAKSFRDDEFTIVSLGTNSYMSALNEICREMKLDANGKLYAALKTMNAYQPASGEKFYISLSGFFL